MRSTQHGRDGGGSSGDGVVVVCFVFFFLSAAAATTNSQEKGKHTIQTRRRYEKTIKQNQTTVLKYLKWFGCDVYTKIYTYTHMPRSHLYFCAVGPKTLNRCSAAAVDASLCITFVCVCTCVCVCLRSFHHIQMYFVVFQNLHNFRQFFPCIANLFISHFQCNEWQLKSRICKWISTGKRVMAPRWKEN